ncbi:hypothetical protein [Confluentibacter citreus]|uniref:hypothetical protein n=1 Tax=Confluentibacter citreus TaxID=2007307 RepID=UPI000C283D6D|nr:hypothetical protein [Confluentibacter citreus]
MDEFILKNYSLITRMVEFTAAITGIFLLRKYKNKEVKHFIYFLVFVAICDLLSSYTRYVLDDRFLSFLIGTKIEKNHWWATLFWKIGAIVFYSYYYQNILITPLFKKVIKIAISLFLIFSTFYIIFHWQDFFIRFFPIISVLGAIIIILCTILYFFELLQSDNILTFYKSINFYISAAIFIWWLIITPIVFFDQYQAYIYNVYERDWDYIYLRRYIYLSCNVLMYGTFTFALIFCRPKTLES